MKKALNDIEEYTLNEYDSFYVRQREYKSKLFLVVDKNKVDDYDLQPESWNKYVIIIMPEIVKEGE